MKPEELIEEAIRLVNTDRQASYDHPFDNFTRISLIWSAILDKEITPEQVALCMVGVKIAREAYAPKDDNIIDGVGYFLTLAKVKEERQKRNGL
jgi:hypothetical protein